MRAPLSVLRPEDLGWLAWPLGDPVVHWRGIVQPVPQHRPRVDFGRAHNTGADEIYRLELRTLWRDRGLGRAPLDGYLAIAVVFAGRSRVNRRLGPRAPEPDVSNVVKAIEDAGNPSPDGVWRGLWRDDRQIKRYVEPFGLVAWGPDVKPFIDLTIWRLEQPVEVAGDEFEAAVA